MSNHLQANFAGFPRTQGDFSLINSELLSGHEKDFMESDGK